MFKIHFLMDKWFGLKGLFLLWADIQINILKS